MTPAVTVLLPVYNGERYLGEAIGSILGQTFGDFEFLIVDDGSTDRSQEIIEGYGDPRIRLLVNPERMKLSGALNRGIDEARGRYIARMDADDIALPERLGRQVAFLNSHPDIGVCGTAIEVFGDARRRTDRYPAGSEGIRSYALFDCPFCHPTVMIRRELLIDHGLRYDGSYYPTEDYELWSRAIELAAAVNLDEVLLRYRIHADSMTGADWDEMDRQAARVIEPRLRRLVPQFSIEDLRFHRNIGRGRSCRLAGLAELDRAERWLASLLAANRDRREYDEHALAETVALVWYRVCMNSSELGLRLFNRYRKSSLSTPGRGAERLATLWASVVKRRAGLVFGRP